jgi:hypothetical protein
MNQGIDRADGRRARPRARRSCYLVKCSGSTLPWPAQTVSDSFLRHRTHIAALEDKAALSQLSIDD